jgi:HK97 family phage major capsid protein/HK97 family phage prohead protease
MDIEKRTFQAELRVSGDKRKISGYGALFDSQSVDLGGFRESIAPGAFADTLKRDLEADPIFLLWQHNSEKPLGTTKNGTLKVWEDSRGLAFEAIPPKTSWAFDAREAIKSGLISQCSFGFEIQEDDWQGGDRRELQKVKLHEVSIVTFPAYPATTVEARKAQKNRRKTMTENLRHECYEHFDFAKMYSKDPLEKKEYLREVEAYDDLAAKLSFPTIRNEGMKGVQRFWDKTGNEPVREPISKPLMETTTRDQDKPFESFADQVSAITRAGLPGGTADRRLSDIRAATGMSEGIPSDGGFLLQDSYASDIIMSAYDVGKIAKLCRRITVGPNSNSIKINGLDETSRVAGSRWGGVRSYYIEEAGEKTASKPTFRQIELNLHKSVVLIYATDEMLNDSKILAGVLRTIARDEIAFTMDSGIIQGNGTGQPLGIKNASCLIDVDKETGQAANSFLLENALSMWSRLLPNSKQNAVWLIHPDLETEMYKMALSIGVGGAAVFMPSAAATPYSTLFGRAVIPCEHCESLGSLGDIYLADFKNGYLIAEKGGVQEDMSISVRFVYDESVYRWVRRWDGSPVLSSAVTPLNGSSTQSHFVSLKARS